VIFSTYQSIAVVAEAQKLGVPDFDLIVCDEAHRTTGVTLDGEDKSHFVSVQARTNETRARLCAFWDGRQFWDGGHKASLGAGLRRPTMRSRPDR
jgi:hypothetical protein